MWAELTPEAGRGAHLELDVDHHYCATPPPYQAEKSPNPPPAAFFFRFAAAADIAPPPPPSGSPNRSTNSLGVGASLRLSLAPVIVGVGAPEARYLPIPAVEFEEEEPSAARALGPVVSRLVPNHLSVTHEGQYHIDCNSLKGTVQGDERGKRKCERGGKIEPKNRSRRPVLVALFLPPPLLIHAQPITLLPLQPLRQPLLIILKRVSKHLDVDQRDGFQRSIRRRVDRDSLNLVEDVLASDETAKDRVLAFFFSREREKMHESVQLKRTVGENGKSILTVQVIASFPESDEELAPVRVGATVRHRQYPALVVLVCRAVRSQVFDQSAGFPRDPKARRRDDDGNGRGKKETDRHSSPGTRPRTAFPTATRLLAPSPLDLHLAAVSIGDGRTM